MLRLGVSVSRFRKAATMIKRIVDKMVSWMRLRRQDMPKIGAFNYLSVGIQDS